MRLLVTLAILFFNTLSQLPPNFENTFTPKDHIEEKGQAKGYYKVFIFLLTSVYFMAYYHLSYHINASLSFIEVILSILILVGFSLRMWSYYTLHKYFTFNLAIKEDHKLIQTGPYKYLIHPSYTGQLLLLFSSILFFRQWIPALLVSYYAIFRYKERVAVEEQMMETQFGEEYRQYKKNRYQAIPFIY